MSSRPSIFGQIRPPALRAFWITGQHLQSQSALAIYIDTDISNIVVAPLKELEFLGDSLERLRAFPQAARRAAGFQLDLVQRGREPDDWKPMTAVGHGVREIRIRDENGAFRVIYVTRLPEAIYVIHAFQKKTQKTSKRDIELAAGRLRELMRTR